MMSRPRSKHARVLGIAPSTKGFGFAVLEGQASLVDWGVKSVKGNKNTQSLVKIEELILQYQPAVLVLQDALDKHSHRSARIQTLGRQIVSLGTRHRVSVALISIERLNGAFFTDGKGTKHARAELFARRFPEELGSRLPPKRKAWMSQDSRMDIFDAVGLAVVWWAKK
jgi:RNase H-fold protein (predicted Holliday junction resolvase)